MSGSGTRRTTILKRRAGKTARLIFYAKRLGVVCVILGVCAFAGYKISHSDWFSRTEIHTVQSIHESTAEAGLQIHNLMIDGRHNASRDDIRAALGIQKNISIFAYDLSDLQKKVTSLPWIKTATVERVLPDTIYIRLQERTPIALWQKDGKLFLVDADGVALTDKNLGAFKDMIVITGDQAPRNAGSLIAMVKAEPDLKARMEIARWIGNRRWDLQLKNGITLRLPEDDPGLAIKRLAEAQAKEKILDRQVQAIDLRDPNRIVVQTEPGAAQKYDAGYKKEKNI